MDFSIEESGTSEFSVRVTDWVDTDVPFAVAAHLAQKPEVEAISCNTGEIGDALVRVRLSKSVPQKVLTDSLNGVSSMDAASDYSPQAWLTHLIHDTSNKPEIMSEFRRAKARIATGRDEENLMLRIAFDHPVDDVIFGKICMALAGSGLVVWLVKSRGELGESCVVCELHPGWRDEQMIREMRATVNNLAGWHNTIWDD